MMADQCRYSRAGAFKRNVFYLDTGLLCHQAGSDMPNGARSGVADADFVRMLLGVFHKFLQVVVRSILRNRQGCCVRVDADDGVEILIGERSQFLGRHGVQFERDHADRISIRFCLHDGCMARSTAAAGDVGNRDGLALRLFFSCFAQCAQHGVRAAAGAPRANHGDVLRRIIDFLGGILLVTTTAPCQQQGQGHCGYCCNC